jgi:translation elongation factor EF-G
MFIAPSIKSPYQVKFFELEVLQKPAERTHKATVKAAIVSILNPVYQVEITTQQPRTDQP